MVFVMRSCAGLIAILLVIAIPVMPCWAGYLLSAQDQGAIYSLVLLRLVGPDDTYNGQLHPKNIYVSETLFAPATAKVILHFYDLLEVRPPLPPPPPPPADEILGGDDVSLITNDVKNILTENARSQVPNINWVKTEHSAQIKSIECGNQYGPLMISFSTLQELSHGKVFVQARLRCGPLFATSYYEVAKIAGSWKIARVIHGPMS